METLHSQNTLVDLLRHQADQNPDQSIYTFLTDGKIEEEQLTCRQLDQQARAIAAFLQKHYAIHGERILLLYPPGLDYIISFFACLYAGAIAVPSYPPRLNKPDTRLNAIITDAQAQFVLTTPDILARLEWRIEHLPASQNLNWLSTETIDLSMSDVWQPPSITSDSIAFLQYTSGSTGKPKGVMVTHHNLLDNLEHIYHCFGHNRHSRGVIWLPPYHDMGLIGGILQPLFGGFPVVLMSPMAFLQTPIRWLQAISHYRATTSGGPNFAYDLCVQQIKPEERSQLNLSSWDMAFCGAEPIRAQTLKRFADYFAPCGFRYQAFYPCYGLAEATLIVSGSSKQTEPTVRSFQADLLTKNQAKLILDDEAQTRSLSLTGCGPSLPTQKIVIVNPETAMSYPSGHVGEIWVAGSSVAKGYWQQPEATTTTFQAYLKETGEGPFLRTGDLGFLYDQELFVIGRLKDMIIIRGQNHYPEDIEQTINDCHPAIQPNAGAVFSLEKGGNEVLIVVYELRRSHRRADVEEVTTAIRQSVSESHTLQVHTVALARPMSVPKTSSGKIQRRRCQELFLENKLELIHLSQLDNPPPQSTVAPVPPFIVRSLQIVSDPSVRQQLLSGYLQNLIVQLTGNHSVNLNESVFRSSNELWPKMDREVQAILGSKYESITEYQTLTINQLTNYLLTRLFDHGY